MLKSSCVSLVVHHLGCIERVQKDFASSIVVVEKFDFKDNESSRTREIQHFTKYVKNREGEVLWCSEVVY